MTVLEQKVALLRTIARDSANMSDHDRALWGLLTTENDVRQAFADENFKQVPIAHGQYFVDGRSDFQSIAGTKRTRDHDIMEIPVGAASQTSSNLAAVQCVESTSPRYTVVGGYALSDGTPLAERTKDLDTAALRDAFLVFLADGLFKHVGEGESNMWLARGQLNIDALARAFGYEDAASAMESLDSD